MVLRSTATGRHLSRSSGRVSRPTPCACSYSGFAEYFLGRIGAPRVWRGGSVLSSSEMNLEATSECARCTANLYSMADLGLTYVNAAALD
jgi:hypothetical protein